MNRITIGLTVTVVASVLLLAFSLSLFGEGKEGDGDHAGGGPAGCLSDVAATEQRTEPDPRQTESCPPSGQGPEASPSPTAAAASPTTRGSGSSTEHVDKPGESKGP